MGAHASAPVESACWVPDVSGCLATGRAGRRAGWDVDCSQELARIAGRAGLVGAPSQIRFMAGFADLLQWNDGVRSGLIGTPRSVAGRVPALEAAGADLVLLGLLPFQRRSGPSART